MKVVPRFRDLRTTMKTMACILVAGACMITLCSCKGKKQEQETVVTPPTITWLTETEHSFGTYHERDTLAFDFVYRNEGPGDFVIERMEASCGCTRASHSRQSVAPGETDTIHVTYDGNGFMPGIFFKVVDIFVDGNIIQRLRIEGCYEPEESTKQ